MCVSVCVWVFLRHAKVGTIVSLVYTVKYWINTHRHIHNDMEMGISCEDDNQLTNNKRNLHAWDNFLFKYFSFFSTLIIQISHDCAQFVFIILLILTVFQKFTHVLGEISIDLWRVGLHSKAEGPYVSVYITSFPHFSCCFNRFGPAKREAKSRHGLLCKNIREYFYLLADSTC